MPVLVTADHVFYGTVVLRDGMIAEVDEGPSRLPQAQDLNGDYLLPGLVELHTDNLEKPHDPASRRGLAVGTPAVLSHDAQIIAAGITTVFDAVSIGDVNPKGNRMQKLPAMLDAISPRPAPDDPRRAPFALALRSCAIRTPSACSAIWWSTRWCNWCR
jgi:alpha-D-ribose 1-methylphosphonate 5-triphosphate diphosphatase